jgi:trimeric autotransporter adhesin
MEVEEENPADVTPLFGLSLNGLAALERRAREGLRQTALDGYVARLTRPGCLPVAERLGAYLRYTLPEPRASEVAVHLAGCAECRAIYAELVDVGATLRTHVAPVFLGSVAAAYLSGAEYHHIAVGQVAEAAADPAGPAAAAAGLAGSDAAASGSGEVSSGLTKTELASTALASTALASTGLANPGLADAGGAGAPPGAGGPPGDPGTGPGHAGGPAVGPVAGAGGPYGLLLAMRRHPRIAAAGGAVLVVIAAVAFALAPSGHKPAPHAADPSPQAGAGGSVGLATGGRPGTVVQTPSPSASTAHSRPPASSSPARGASSGPAGGTSPSSASASPDPSPTPSAAPDVTLSASVSVFGGGNMAQVVFQVGDTGSAATSGLSASIGLPSGAAMVAGGNGRHHDPWSCQPTSSGASCQHDPISAGQQTFGVILIQLTGAAACGQPVQLTVTSGSVSASAQSPQTIQCGNRGNARGAGGLAAGAATGLAAS